MIDMAVNKVVYAGDTLLDLTNDSVTEDTLVSGATAHNAAGLQITGTATLGVSLESVYPVGSIYISTNSINPAILFGFGEWVAIRNRFLLGTDPDISGTYTLGATGGEETHTLTIAEMPSHNHSLKMGYGDNTYDTISGSNAESEHWQSSTNIIANTGGGQAHNNMPPYLVVVMWERIA